MHREREKDNLKSREVKRLKECALALSKMSNARASKPPAKYSDCVTGAELDDIIRNQSNWASQRYINSATAN